jgi:hypothetical protein
MFKRQTRDMLVVAGVITLALILWSRRSPKVPSTVTTGNTDTTKPTNQVLYNASDGSLVVSTQTTPQTMLTPLVQTAQSATDR